MKKNLMKASTAMKNKISIKIFLILLLLLITAGFVSGTIVVSATEGGTVMKSFSQLTEAEKERVLQSLLDSGAVPSHVNVSSSNYTLNEQLWMARGIIAYGITANVNAANQTTGSPNYKDGHYRYWGYDLNRGLYCNDDFPRDSDSGTAAYMKDWLTVTQIKTNQTAANYVGKFAIQAGFSTADKHATASVFLSENPAWRNAGLDEDYIIEHFYFNSVLSDSGLTQGQFIGVHKSVYDGRLYYQTFSVEGEVMLFEVPPENPAPPEEPDDPPILPPEPEPGIEISVNPELSLPPTTYAGHPTLAEDSSVFLVGEELWSAARAYAEGKATNRFTAADSTTKRISDTRATVTYQTPGDYSVKLRVTPEGGNEASVTKPIQVLPTPTILHNLTGPLKQNRKTTLHIAVAKNPGVDLASLRVELEHPDTGETISLHHNMGSSENSFSNSATIKTRPIQAQASDEFYFNCHLEFLTKNMENTDYRYTIYAEDKNGNKDQVTADFSVSQDEPPEADLFLESCYIRNAASNQAEIVVEDGTLTDGDQIHRTWLYTEVGGEEWIPLEAMPGNRDYSFGRGKKVAFLKEGVGPFEIKLITKDVWVEETLPEYITEGDYLTGEAVRASEVINVAPVVSLEPIAVKTADITILAGGTAEYDRVKANLSRIEQELLRQRVDAHITLEKMVPTASHNGGKAATRTATIKTPFGYEGEWTFYEDENYIVDEERFYKIDASWPSTDNKGYPVSPYTISCWDWDAASGEKRWTYTFTDELLTVPKTGPYFAQDDTGQFLYFVANGKTLILTKDNGSFLTLLNMEVGKNCFAEKEQIYTIKEDGIYRISALSGQVSKIYKGTIIDGKFKRLEGKIHFVTGHGDTMNRGTFDPERGSVELQKLPLPHSSPGVPTHELLGVDVDGKLIINTVTRERTSGGDLDNSYITQTRIYSRDNQLYFTSPEKRDSKRPQQTVTPIYDEGGRCNYLVYTWDTSSSSYDYNHATLYGVHDGYVKQTYIRDDEELTMSDKVPFAREIDGQIYVCNGAYWVYVYNMGYNIYQQRLKVFVFDPETDIVRAGDYYNELDIPLRTVENGYTSDALAALQVGYNSVGNGESINYILKWEQSLSQILKRYTEKNFKAGKDINAVIVYDETNAAGYEELLMDSLTAKLERRNGRLIITDRESVEGSGLGEALLAAGEKEKNVLGVSVEQELQGTISKTYNLNPNQTYYYEYEMKRADGFSGDSLIVSPLTESPEGAQFSAGGFGTTVSYFEDFEDQDTNLFFTIAGSGVSEGYYKGADLYRKTDSNRYSYDPSNPETTAITFTVPEGKQGVLSFNYLLQKSYAYSGGNSDWTQSYVKIDDKLWNACVPNSGTGHYSHPELLQPGEHVLTFFASEYGKEVRAKLWLDTLSVDLVEETQGSMPIDAENETLSIEPLPGGYVRIKGSFKALPQIGAYGQVRNAEVIDGDIGVANHTVWKNTNPDKKAFDFQIPDGKTAIFTLVSTLSNPKWRNDRNYSVTYTLPLFYKNKEDGWINHRWNVLAKNSNSQDAMHNCPNDYDLNPGELEGTKSFSLTASAYNNTSGDFTNMTSVIVDTDKKGWGNMNYFLSGEDSDKKYYLQKDAYKGASLTFQLPEGNHFIRNLQLYSVQDGVKVYADTETFSDASSLNRWTAQQADTAIIQESPADKEEKGLVYKLNEMVHYAIDYYDYEEDPSKKEFWRYTHTPFNLGPHPDAAVILNESGDVVSISGTVLNEPIQRFSVDGKYTVEHWQEDNTTRPVLPAGNPDYDKLSNVEMRTFYVQGSGSGPWIESIGTIPKVVKEGNQYRLQIRVDDTEKDELRLTTELYREQKLIFAQTHTGIQAHVTGVYPAVLTDSVPVPAEAGRYQVVCTVSDQTGTGVGSHDFIVVSEGKITGWISHTDEWNENRKKYNVSLFGEEFNQKVTYNEYVGMKAPRKRGTNVFWSGERFLLSAHVAGNPQRVTAEILGAAGYQTVLTSTGKKDPQGETIYQGELWDRTMLNRWGKSKPQQVNFQFTAEYEGEITKTFDDYVIVDSKMDYWLLHRLW